MRLQPKTVKIAALLGAGLLLVVVAFAAVMTVLIRDADKKLPEVEAFSHGKSVTLGPIIHCTVMLEDCIPEGTPTELDVPRGGALQISLPKEISSAPWHLVTVSETADGHIKTRVRKYRPDEAKAVTVSEPDEQLNGVEVQLPSAFLDENGNDSRVAAAWSIKTA